MMADKLSSAALRTQFPWSVLGVDFDECKQKLTIKVDFAANCCFAHPDKAEEHPVHDTRFKRCRHLNLFQHDYFLEVRIPRACILDEKVLPLEPHRFGTLDGFTRLFEVLALVHSASKCVVRWWPDRGLVLAPRVCDLRTLRGVGAGR